MKWNININCLAVLPYSCCHYSSTISCSGFWHTSHSGLLPWFLNDTEERNQKNILDWFQRPYYKYCMTATYWYCIEIVDGIQTHLSVLQQWVVRVHAAFSAAVWAQPIAVAVHQHHVTVAAGCFSTTRFRYDPLSWSRKACCTCLCVCLWCALPGLSLWISSCLQVLLAVREAVSAAQLRQAKTTWSATSAAGLWAAWGAAGAAERRCWLPARGRGGCRKTAELKGHFLCSR